ncbi:MAG: RNA pyrophosphohydrolase [Alphaproteobacteria bacterium]|nr:RNA pyrophosphohydrolase [Alphaproteobacteria bacterium]
MIAANSLPYRPCVGIALFNGDGSVFVGERIDSPGAWQMPQGGIDSGETVDQAAFRELEEEVGSANAALLRIHDVPLRYDLPDSIRHKLWNGRYRGQEQTWVAMRFLGDNDEIDICRHSPPEFQRWQWVPLSDVCDLIVPFKRDTYRKVIEAFEEFAVQ